MFNVHLLFLAETELMHTFRTYLQTIFPVCGDLLLGETQIRRQRLAEVNVPQGARVLVNNTQHAFQPSKLEDMERRRYALLDKQLPYRLFTQNCEHFATFVRYGKAVCNQVSTESTVNSSEIKRSSHPLQIIVIIQESTFDYTTVFMFVISSSQ